MPRRWRYTPPSSRGLLPGRGGSPASTPKVSIFFATGRPGASPSSSALPLLMQRERNSCVSSGLLAAAKRKAESDRDQGSAPSLVLERIFFPVLAFVASRQ